MSEAAASSLELAPKPGAWDEAIAWIAGGAFTFALFFAMAHVENGDVREPVAAIEDMRMVAMPFEPPPPPSKIAEPVAPPEDVSPLSAMDLGASDSPIKIAVLPRDLEALFPTAQTPPRATLQVGRVYTEFKPGAGIDVDVRHVYQTSEVDQPPRAVVRATPVVPTDVFGRARTLRVVLILVIDQNGRVESARVAESSGKPVFDAIVMKTVKEGWEFSPAIRRGKKVRCLAQQPFRVNLSGGSPFDVQ